MSTFDYKLFGHKMRVMRIGCGLTEEQAAERYGVSVARLKKWEAGMLVGRGLTTALICFVRKVDGCAQYLNWLFGQDTVPPRNGGAYLKRVQ